MFVCVTSLQIIYCEIDNTLRFIYSFISLTFYIIFIHFLFDKCLLFDSCINSNTYYYYYYYYQQQQQQQQVMVGVVVIVILLLVVGSISSISNIINICGNSSRGVIILHVRVSWSVLCWTDRCRNGWVDGQMDKCVCRWMDR